jgi:virginiamycin B lyase
MNRGVSILIAVLLTMAFGASTLQAANLTGVVRDTSGKPVEGALVKVSGTDTGLSYLVVSQTQGRYSTPKLLLGSYTVQAFGGRYQSDSAGLVEVSNDQQVEADRILNTARVIPPPALRLANADYAQLMPEGEAKQLIVATCIRCHGLDRVVPARKTPEAWQITVNRMGYFLEDRSDLRQPLSPQEKQSILDYLAKNFTRDTPRIPEPGPSDPNQHLPGTLLEGEKTRFVVMEFDPKTNADRLEIGVDSQGNPWLSEGGTAFFGWFDPATLTYNRIETPPGSDPRDLGQIAVDPEGQIWVLDNGPDPDAELLSFDPKSREFKSYAISAPPGYKAPLNTLRFLDGNVWGTGNVSSRVVKLDPSTGKITTYPSPRGSHPYGIAIADKAVWYITNYKNEIIRLDPQTGEQIPYLAPTPKSGLRRMGADAVGNLWVGAQDSNKLLKLDTRSGEYTEYTVPTKNSAPYSVDVDTTSNLVWFSERDADKIGRFDPGTETFVEFPLLTAGIEARRILVDPVNPNRIWWGCASSMDLFGYIEILD